MNYIEQIKGFWLANEEHSFLPDDIALYFYLLEVNNNCCWKEYFKRNNQKIIADLNLSYKRLHTSRQKLQNCELITFQTKNGSPNVIYNLVHIGRGYRRGFGEVHAEVAGEVSARFRETKDKLNKTKLNKKNNPPYVPPPEGESYDKDKISDNPIKLPEEKKEKSSAKKERKVFVPPFLDEVTAYCKENNYTINPCKFVNYYTSNGWMVGKNKMKDWKAAIRTWQAKENDNYGKNQHNRRVPNSGQSDFD